MQIIAHNQVAGCTLYVFDFKSRERDFVPIMASLKSCAGMVSDKIIREAFLEILSTMESRCDTSDGPGEVSSYLFAGEMAHFSMYLVFTMLLAEVIIRRNSEMEMMADCIFGAIREGLLH